MFRGLFVHRVWVPFLIVICFAMLAIGRYQPRWVEDIRAAGFDRVAPLLEHIAQPVDYLTALGEQALAHVSLIEKYRELREENVKLKGALTAHLALRVKHAQIRKLLKLPLDPALGFVSARVISKASGPLIHKATANTGSDHGVAPGQAVIDSAGFVGRIVHTGKSTSRILLFSDYDSRVPVKVGVSGNRAVMVGDYSLHPKLLFFGLGSQIASGDMVITSGDGGVLPPGLPVGRVVVRDKKFRVVPFSNLRQLGFVRVLRPGRLARDSHRELVARSVSSVLPTRKN